MMSRVFPASPDPSVRTAEKSDGIGWGFGDFMVEIYYENLKKSESF